MTESAGRRKVLVMGATGFVGSHVTRKLVERGDDVRVYLRKSSNTVAIDDLDVERCYGDLRDEDAVRAAMSDRDVVFYCVVDTRFYLRDPTPLFETNVESLRRVLDVAAHADLDRFVFCSTIGTIAIAENGESATEDMPFNWAGKGGAYIESRRQAEDLVLDYARTKGLPAVALCVSNPYGPLDWQPNQGLMVQMAALGKDAGIRQGRVSRGRRHRGCGRRFPARRRARSRRGALHHLRKLHAHAGDARHRRFGGRREAAQVRSSSCIGVCVRLDTRSGESSSAARPSDECQRRSTHATSCRPQITARRRGNSAGGPARPPNR